MEHFVRMLATSHNRETRLQLKLLDLDFQAQQRQYAEKVLELAELRHKLDREVNRKSKSDYDEGNRREAMQELQKKIDGFVMPLPPDRARYYTQKEIYQMKLRHNDRLNASLLIWQVMEAKN